jgi:hypothetical protein
MPVEKVTTLDRIKVSVTPKQYSKVNIRTIGTITPEIEGVYPFRVRFKDLGYPGISGNNAPGIGLAIIGSTFLIL